jgi:hypothetical protein
MAREKPPTSVKMAFEVESVAIPVGDIQPLRLVTDAAKKGIKYAQIAASVQEIGIIEPPVVARDRGRRGKYLLLDGHLRLEALKDLGETVVACLISTDDEAFTYNKRVSRLAMVQEHRMILKAIEKGVAEERIARALNVDIRTLRQKKKLLTGICREAIELLQDKHVPLKTFATLRKMGPMRQIESIQLMIAMNTYTSGYARSLLAATPQSQLADADKPKSVKGLTDEQMALMERESVNLEQAFKAVERSYGTDHLDFVLLKGYLGKLVGNSRVAQYLGLHHREILVEFQKLSAIVSVAA